MTEPVEGHSESGHDYLSTACYHKLHGRCRIECKFCNSQCRCECHGDKGDQK